MRVEKISGGNVGIALAPEEADKLTQILLRPAANDEFADALNEQLLDVLIRQPRPKSPLEDLVP